MQGFENKEQEREIWADLRRRSVPAKFAYVGDAAYNRNMLAYQSTNKVVTEATIIEMAAIKSHFDTNKHIPQQICDVGPGNGVHSAAFLAAFCSSGYKVDKYLGLDFSKTLLIIGTKLIKAHFPELKVEFDTWDFEKAPTTAISRWRTAGPTLITLTGHTLGSPENTQQVLQFLHDSCIPDDILILGVALMYDCSPESYVNAYNNDIFKDAALEPLRMVGIRVEEGDFNLKFSTSEKAIIAEFICRSDITIEYEGEQIRFNRGDSIQCFRSRRFVDAEVKSLLSASGWNLQSEAYDDGKTRAVYLSTMQPS